MTFVTCHVVTVRPNIGVGKRVFRAILYGWRQSFHWEMFMAMKVRVLLSSVLALGMICLASCNGHYHCGTAFGGTCGTGGSSTGTGGTGGTGTGGSGTAAAYEYLENGAYINAAVLDTSGSFGLVPDFVIPEGTYSGIGGMIVVQKQWLYLALTGGLAIEGFTINGSTAALTTIPGSPVTSADTNAITSDPAGKFLFLCGADADEVSVFAINQTTGALTLVGTYPANVGFAEQATTDGLGKFLYVTAGNLGSVVTVFSIGSDGSLTIVSGSPFSISIAQLTGEPTGKFLFGITGNGANNGGFGNDNHVYVYSINQTTGVLTPVSGSPFATTYIPATLTVHPSGTLVYTFNKTATAASPMEGFSFDISTGALTPVANSPFNAFTEPEGFFDQTGAYLFLGASAASVDTTTGDLTAVGTSLTGVGSPIWFVPTDPN